MPPATLGREALDGARLAVERDGGRLWSEEDDEAGETTYFVLFGEPGSDAAAPLNA
jgi:hypothetical protein